MANREAGNAVRSRIAMNLREPVWPGPSTLVEPNHGGKGGGSEMVRDASRYPRQTGHGATVWLTGPPSAGKSTLANGIFQILQESSYGAEVLDGDKCRTWLTPDLGFCWDDRIANTLRIGAVARLLARHGAIVIVASIAPSSQARQQVSNLHSVNGLPFIEVHVDAPLAVLRKRDTKGLYQRFKVGSITNLTGLDQPYEEPLTPDLKLDTSKNPVHVNVEELARFLSYRLDIDVSGRAARTETLRPST